MGFRRQLIAFGGFVLVGSIVLSNGEALAFGQQWRPAPGFGPAQFGTSDRVSKMPSFRPRTVARPAYHQTFDRIGQRPYRQRPYLWQPYPQPIAAWQGYPARHGATPYFAGLHQPQPGFYTTGYPGGGWAPPFAAMAQPWRQQVPLFARQFAWRPAGQPWVAPPPMPRRPDYRVKMAPKMVGYRPTGPGHAPIAGSWRPVVRPAPAIRPQYANQGYVAQRPVYNAGQQPGFGAAPFSGYQVPGARVASLNPARVAVGRGYWRPQARAHAASRGSTTPFRPQAYGRSLVARKEVAPRNWGGSESTRDNLPGWVTTYQDTGYEGS